MSEGYLTKDKLSRILDSTDSKFLEPWPTKTELGTAQPQLVDILTLLLPGGGAGLKKLGIRGIQDTRQFAFG